MNEMTQMGFEAEQKSTAYAGLARHYLNNGETWMAVHAQVASDLFAAKTACGVDPSLIVDEDGSAPFAAFLASSPTTIFASTADSFNAVEHIRKGIESLLPEEAIEAWESRRSDISGFQAKVLGTDLLASAFVSARLGDLEPEDFVIARFEEAAELYADASEAELSGDLHSSIKARHQGDLAMLEGWLVQRSLDVNDAALIQTTLRWDLAMNAIDSLEELPEEPQAAARIIRSRMAWALGPEDAKKFSELFIA
jgi:hypothetical protein